MDDADKLRSATQRRLRDFQKVRGGSADPHPTHTPPPH
ncbi:hypothetical protein chiPu_0026655, partial [Chiloscyllium punctatum]|nr:hypothetical protein [Chiloscyllium punctatum]